MKTTEFLGLNVPELADSPPDITKFSENYPKIDTNAKSVKEQINSLDANKVDKIANKGLSTNDYTTTEKNKLAGIETGASADQTASEILSALKTVDGSGSGLDADTIAGISSADLLKRTNAIQYVFWAGFAAGWIRLASGSHANVLLNISETSYAESENLLWIGSKYTNDNSPVLVILGRANYSSRITKFRLLTEGSDWYLDALFATDATSSHVIAMSSYIGSCNFPATITLGDLTGKTLRATVDASAGIVMASSHYIGVEKGIKVGTTKILDTAVRIQSATPTDTTALWAW